MRAVPPGCCALAPIGHAAVAPKSAINSLSLIDHLVGACEERGWESEAERIGRFQVQHEVEARGLFDWQFARRDPSQDAVDVKGRAPPQVGSVDGVSNQSSGSSISDVADDSRE